jgi:hypothetical protein
MLCNGTEESITTTHTSDDNRKEEKKDRFSIGTIITKYWNGVPYKGEVIDNTNRYYKILYEDNDEEELNHKEVEQYMNKNRGDGRTIKEIGTRMRLKIKVRDWKKTATALERLWPFYYSNKKDTLYRSYREEWHRQEEFNYNCHTRNDKSTYEYTTSENIKVLPEDAVPVDAMDTTEEWRISGQLLIMTT